MGLLAHVVLGEAVANETAVSVVVPRSMLLRLVLLLGGALARCHLTSPLALRPCPLGLWLSRSALRRCRRQTSSSCRVKPVRSGTLLPMGCSIGSTSAPATALRMNPSCSLLPLSIASWKVRADWIVLRCG